MNVGDVVEVDVTRIATSGEGVARAPDGRTLFVAGALPGERVRAAVTEVRKRHGRAEAVEVQVAAPGRRVPPCPHVADGCGGCDWQHADDALQAELRRTIVRDALERIGRLPDPAVEPGVAIADPRRTGVRVAVVDGRAGYRRRRSHDVLVPETCLVVRPRLEEMVVAGRYAGDEVVLRIGARTGEVAVDATVHEEVAGRRWRVSAGSFWQPSAEAAEALVHEVGEALDGAVGGTLIDLASGVGLFAGTVGARFDEVVAVEISPSAVADAEVNLADLPVRIVRSILERWTPEPATAVVADPPRAGLAQAGVDVVAATGAPTVVLISCDAASLGRDAGLLVAAGYRHERSRVLDLFPQTSHVEVVTRFTRG